MADDTETGTPVPDKAEPLTDGEVVALKSADVHAESSERHVKVFVLPPGPKPTPQNGYDHEANKAAVIQYMISQGLRPTGDVRHVSTKQHDNGVSWVLTYDVAAIPTASAAGASGPDIVLGSDGEAPTATSGAGHSDDTTGKTPGKA